MRYRPKKLKKVAKYNEETSAVTPDVLATFLTNYRRRVNRKPEDYLTLSAIQNAVHRFINTFGYLDRSVVRFHNGRRETLHEHPVSYLLQNPSTQMSGFEFWRTVFRRYLFKPNSFVEIGFAGDLYSELFLPEDDSIKPSFDGGFLTYKVEGGESLDPHEVLHFRGASFDGFSGSSLFEGAAKELELALNAIDFARNYFRNGAAPSGYYTAPGTLSQKMIDDIKAQHFEELAGLENVGRTPIFGKGVTWSPYTNDLEKSQLAQVRINAAKDAAQLLGFPLSMLEGNPTDSAKAEFVESLRLHLEVFEAELTFKLLSPIDRAQGYAIEHDLSALRRSDPSAKVDDLTKGFGFGAVSIDEWRQGAGLDPLPEGGDLRLVATNNLDTVKNLEDVETLIDDDDKEDVIKKVLHAEISRNMRRAQRALKKADTISAKEQVYATEQKHIMKLEAYARLAGVTPQKLWIEYRDCMEMDEDEAIESIIKNLFGGDDA